MHGRVPQFRGPHASQRPSKLYTMDQREYNLAPGQPASTLVRVYSVYVFIYLYIYIYIYIYYVLYPFTFYPNRIVSRASVTKSKTRDERDFTYLQASLISPNLTFMHHRVISWYLLLLLLLPLWSRRETYLGTSNPPKCGAEETTRRRTRVTVGSSCSFPFFFISSSFSLRVIKTRCFDLPIFNVYNCLTSLFFRTDRTRLLASYF